MNTAGINPVAVPPASSIAFLQKKVMICLPWGKSVHPLTAFSVAQLMDRRRTVTSLNFGDAFVAHSRNSCADLFLSTDSDYLLTIDDDMIIPFGHAEWFNSSTRWNLPPKFAGMNAIDRLLSHGKTLVGGLYWGRYPKANPMYGEGPKEVEYARTAPIDLLKPTRWVATGCMMIHRNVFLDIEKRFPRLARGADGKGGNWFSSSEHNLTDSVDRVRAMLSTGPMDGTKAMKAYELLEAAAADATRNSSLGMGEDVTFCVRAAQAGHQPHVDFGLRCGHIGHHVF